MTRLPALLVLTLAWQPLVCVDAQSATYYVNPSLGADNNTGTNSTPSAGSTVGPWQTFAPLQSAQLRPGDTVYVACGSRLSETLRIPISGTTAAPLRIAGGPGTCVTPPSIDGAVSIPAHAWSPYAGSIYRTRLPVQLISNPTLATSTAEWRHWSSFGDSSLQYDSACPGAPAGCMRVTSGGTASLAISNDFPLDAGVDYEVSVMVKTPPGVPLKLVIRRGEAPYDPLGTYVTVAPMAGWQTVQFPFRPAKPTPKGRLDIELPGGVVTAYVREAYVRRVLGGPVAGLFVDTLAIRPAHHPNFGAIDGNAASPFAIAASGTGNWLDIGSMPVPVGATITPGLTIAAKMAPFLLDERSITSVAGTRVTFNSPTTYPTKAGTAFYLKGALWMLDSPGEWHVDAASGYLYVWMPDSSTPGGRVSFTTLNRGMDFATRENIEIDGIKVRAVVTGVSLTYAKSVRIKNTVLHDIVANAVEADNCANCSLERSDIRRTGLDAVRAIGAMTLGFRLTDSTVRESGAVERSDGWRWLPRPSRAAVDVGVNATISGNDVVTTSNSGIFAGQQSIVAMNYIGRTCLRYNDCGGIYVNYVGNRTIIDRNLVYDIPGGLAGLPQFAPNQAVGIYLDDGASDVEVSGNTIAGAELGLHVHNSGSHWIRSNLFYGNRRYQLWLQETTAVRRVNGDIHSNRIDNNLFIPLAGGPSVMLESEVGEIVDFASFTSNHYSALFSPRVVGSKWPTGSASYLLGEWMTTPQDPSANQTLPTGYASFFAIGSNLVPNGSITSGIAGWTWWNQALPSANAEILQCTSGPCIRISGGGSATLLSSPNFSVTEGQWYRVAFDASTSPSGQPINVLVRRGGGGSAGYEPLMTTSESLAGGAATRRYSFVFRATKTVVANNPQTGELGARIDFERIQPGSLLTVSKVEMIPLQPVQAALQLRMPVNITRQSSMADCTPGDIAANLCTKFVSMVAGSPVFWPLVVPLLSGVPIYTRDVSLVDTDGDGVSDTQDKCPGTLPGQAVNAAGCALAQ